MNKHFSDSRYYLERAAEHATLGLSEVLEPHARRARELLGRNPDPEPEPSRLESVRDELASLERTAERRARAAVGSARATLSRSPSDESAGDR